VVTFFYGFFNLRLDALLIFVAGLRFFCAFLISDDRSGPMIGVSGVVENFLSVALS
jgi:hypothetical protein